MSDSLAIILRASNLEGYACLSNSLIGSCTLNGELVNIPRGGSKGVYVNIHLKVCDQKYTIENGVVRTENMEFRLNELDFEYSCDITNVREEKGLVNNPEGRTLIESAVSYQLGRKELSGDNVVREVAKYLLEMFRLIKVGEREGQCVM